MSGMIYIVLVNIITFLLFGEDKKRARQQKWRIAEQTLFFFALLGGSAGALLGMHIFHHKTHKWKFRLGIPVLLVLQVLIFFWDSLEKPLYFLLTNNIIQNII